MKIISIYVLGINPFFEAFSETDLMGKCIFLGLVMLSVVSWVLIVHKVRMLRHVRRLAEEFRAVFEEQKAQPLGVQYNFSVQGQGEFPHPFWDLYQALRTTSTEILNKNRVFAKSAQIALPEGSSYLCQADIDLVESHLASTIDTSTKALEKNLFVLSTVVTLAPFLGLLGTVWGILTTFTALQTQVSGTTNQAVLHGLSLALAATVLGLIDAIPALVGYNYLKNTTTGFRGDMENFANKILSIIEFHYRKVDTI